MLDSVGMNNTITKQIEKLGKQLDRLQRQREYLIYRDGQIFKSVHNGVDYSIDGDIERTIDQIDALKDQLP